MMNRERRRIHKCRLNDETENFVDLEQERRDLAKKKRE